jgi:hypothetical protein
LCLSWLVAIGIARDDVMRLAESDLGYLSETHKTFPVFCVVAKV